MDNLNGFKEADLMDLKDTRHMFPDKRPDWDSWFMALCFVIAQRSLDKNTKHGCVAVDDSHSILSVGYNSPPRGCPDSKVPLDRPRKYHIMGHAETNSIANAASMGTSLKGSTFYITGPPCCSCFISIVNVGAVKIIQGPILHQRTQDQIDAVKLMNSNKQIEIIDFKNINSVLGLIERTAGYINTKIGDGNEAEEASTNS